MVISHLQTGLPSRSGMASECTIFASQCYQISMSTIIVLAESTKTRNRKSPQFSVTNVPVASQTAVGTFFPRKIAKRIDIASDILSQGKLQGFSGGKTVLGSKKSLRFSHLRQKVAIAIAEKLRHLAHSCFETTTHQDVMLAPRRMNPK